MAFKKKSKTNFWSGGGYGYGGYEGKSYAMFQTEMSGTTAVFGRDNGITVSFGGEKIEVKENNVNFPALDASVYLDNSTLKLCRGFVDGESAKFRFSDRNVSRLIKTSHEQKNPLLYNLYRAVEDVRTEGLYIEKYVGSQKNLNEAADKCAKRFLSENNIGWRKEVPMGHIAPMAISSQARKDMDYFGFGLGDVIASVPKEEMDNVECWAARISDCQSSYHCWTLAQEIFKEIEQAGHDIPPPQQPKSQPEKGKEEGDKEGEEESEGEGEFKFRIDIDSIVHDELKGMRDPKHATGERCPYFPASTEFDLVHHWSSPDPTYQQQKDAINGIKYYGQINMKRNADIIAYKKMAQHLGPIINVARRKLELLLMAQRRTEWEYQKDRGRFDSRRMAAVVAGDWNVFKTKEQEPSMDTAVSLMIDLSGSMFSDGKRKVATQTAIVLAECLSRIGIPFEILGYDCCFAAKNKEYWDKISKLRHDLSSKKYSRVEQLHTHVFKSFKDRFFDARPYIMGLSNKTNIQDLEVGTQSNADGESLLIGHQRLLARPEQKKIMLVLSDGQPAHTAYSDYQPIDYLKKVVKDIEAKGTTIVGIGIMTTDVMKFYSKNIVCEKAEDLAGTALKALSDVLLNKEKKKIAT